MDNLLRFVCAFFRNYGLWGGFKASLNCNRSDEFDRSAQSLASKNMQCAPGCGLGRPGEGAAAPFVKRENRQFFFGGGGGGESPSFWDRAVEFIAQRGKHDNQT